MEAKTQQDATTEAREVDWMKFLTARCGIVGLALAAVADGAELSKKQTKLLGRRQGNQDDESSMRRTCRSTCATPWLRRR